MSDIFRAIWIVDGDGIPIVALDPESEEFRVLAESLRFLPRTSGGTEGPVPPPAQPKGTEE